MKDFRDWLQKDLFVELWETRPTLTDKKLEDDSVVKEAVIGSDNKPVLVTRLRGIIRINTMEFSMKPELTAEDVTFHKKVFFFDQKYLQVPEFTSRNYFNHLKDQEKEMLAE